MGRYGRSPGCGRWIRSGTSSRSTGGSPSTSSPRLPARHVGRLPARLRRPAHLPTARPHAGVRACRAEEVRRHGADRVRDGARRDGLGARPGRRPSPEPHPRPVPDRQRGLPVRAGHHGGRTETVDRPVRVASAVRAGDREPGPGGPADGRDDGHLPRALHLRRVRAAARRLRTGDVRLRPRQPPGRRGHVTHHGRVVSGAVAPDRGTGVARRAGRTAADGTGVPAAAGVGAGWCTGRCGCAQSSSGCCRPPGTVPRGPKPRTYPFGWTLDDLGPHWAQSRPLEPCGTRHR